MLRLRPLLCLAGALLVAGCTVGGVGYDPDRGLVLGGKDGGDSGDTQAQASQPSASSDGDVGMGLTLGKLFGPSARPEQGGYTVGDEPYAVKAGADILAQGGSAADAATAMYFALAVTYPGAAGLGGGGLCIAYDGAGHKSEAIDFLARNTATPGDFGVPGNVAGFATLQAHFGTLPWGRDVAYGEAMAATGFPISDALAARLKAAQNVVRLDAGLAAEFLDESGKVKPAGTVVTNPDLAQTLTQIREHGMSAFYRGAIAHAIAQYAGEQSGGISLGDLAAYRAHARAPQIVRLGNQYLQLPPAEVGAGSFAGAVMSQLVGAGDEPVAGNAAALTRAAVQSALRRFGVGRLPQDLGATGFAALDANGQGVACAVTMNGPFGSGHTAQGTGVTLAASPAHGAQGLAGAFLTPMLATRNITGPIRLPDEAPSYAVTLAGAGAGGPEGTAAMAYSALRLARDEDMTRPGDLHAQMTSAYDTVNAIACQHGICAVLADPKSHGAGAAAPLPATN